MYSLGYGCTILAVFFYFVSIYARRNHLPASRFLLGCAIGAALGGAVALVAFAPA